MSVKTWEMASATRKAAEASDRTLDEMREARDQESAPYVVAYFDIPEGSSLIYLVLKNIGNSSAVNVRVAVDPPFQTSHDRPIIDQLGFLKEGVGSMPPKYELRTIFDSANRYFQRDELPLQYEVKIAYYGGIRSDERISDQVLDLSAQKNLVYIPRKNMNDLVWQIEKLTDETRKNREATENLSETMRKGVFISNPAFMMANLSADLPNSKKILISKAREFRYLWQNSFREDRNNGIGLEQLQAHALITGNQLLTVLAYVQEEAEPYFHEKAAAIAEHLHKLSRMRFYFDGGASLQEFNALGDSIMTDISSLVEIGLDESNSPQLLSSGYGDPRKVPNPKEESAEPVATSSDLGPQEAENRSTAETNMVRSDNSPFNENS